MDGLQELRRWWKVPCIAHFCSLFRGVLFEQSDLDIEDLEEALIQAITPEDSPIILDLICSLLEGIYGREKLTVMDYDKYIKDIFRYHHGLGNINRNPLANKTYFEMSLRDKVDVLHNLCDFRLEADDVMEVLKGHDGDNMRVEPLGNDKNGATYWYFYGTRLYQEDAPPKEPEEEKTPKHSKHSKKSNKKKKKKSERDRRAENRTTKHKAEKLIEVEESVTDTCQVPRRKSKRQTIKQLTGVATEEDGENQTNTDKPDDNLEIHLKDNVCKMSTVDNLDATACVKGVFSVIDDILSDIKNVIEKQENDGCEKFKSEEKIDVKLLDLDQKIVVESPDIKEETMDIKYEVKLENECKYEVDNMETVCLEIMGYILDTVAGSECKMSEVDEYVPNIEVGKEVEIETNAADTSDTGENRTDNEKDIDENETGETLDEDIVTTKPMVANGFLTSGDQENKEVEEEEEMEPEEPSRWHMVCSTLEDWQNLSEFFRESEFKSEKALYRTIVDDFLPEIPNIMAEREKELTRRLMQNAPRRQSSRLEIKRIEQEESERQQALQEVEEEKLQAIQDEKRMERVRQARVEDQKKAREERERVREERANRIKKREERARLLAEGIEVPEELRNLESPVPEPEVKLQNLIVDNEVTVTMYKVLDSLKNHNDSWLFWEPVEETFAPGYFDVVKHPMDLMKVEAKVNNREYKRTDDFFDDLHLMFDNCILYNGTDSDYAYMATQLRNHLKKVYKKLIPKEEEDEDYIPDPHDKPFEPITIESRTISPKPYVYKPKPRKKPDYQATYEKAVYDDMIKCPPKKSTGTFKHGNYMVHMMIPNQRTQSHEKIFQQLDKDTEAYKSATQSVKKVYKQLPPLAVYPLPKPNTLSTLDPDDPFANRFKRKVDPYNIIPKPPAVPPNTTGNHKVDTITSPQNPTVKKNVWKISQEDMVKYRKIAQENNGMVEIKGQDGKILKLQFKTVPKAPVASGTSGSAGAAPQDTLKTATPLGSAPQGATQEASAPGIVRQSSPTPTSTDSVPSTASPLDEKQTNITDTQPNFTPSTAPSIPPSIPSAQSASTSHDKQSTTNSADTQTATSIATESETNYETIKLDEAAMAAVDSVLEDYDSVKSQLTNPAKCSESTNMVAEIKNNSSKNTDFDNQSNVSSKTLSETENNQDQPIEIDADIDQSNKISVQTEMNYEDFKKTVELTNDSKNKTRFSKSKSTNKKQSLEMLEEKLRKGHVIGVSPVVHLKRLKEIKKTVKDENVNGVIIRGIHHGVESTNGIKCKSITKSTKEAQQKDLQSKGDDSEFDDEDEIPLKKLWHPVVQSPDKMKLTICRGRKESTENLETAEASPKAGILKKIGTFDKTNFTKLKHKMLEESPDNTTVEESAEINGDQPPKKKKRVSFSDKLSIRNLPPVGSILDFGTVEDENSVIVESSNINQVLNVCEESAIETPPSTSEGSPKNNPIKKKKGELTTLQQKIKQIKSDSSSQKYVCDFDSDDGEELFPLKTPSRDNLINKKGQTLPRRPCSYLKTSSCSTLRSKPHQFSVNAPHSLPTKANKGTVISVFRRPKSKTSNVSPISSSITDTGVAPLEETGNNASQESVPSEKCPVETKDTAVSTDNIISNSDNEADDLDEEQPFEIDIEEQKRAESLIKNLVKEITKSGELRKLTNRKQKTTNRDSETTIHSPNENCEMLSQSVNVDIQEDPGKSQLECENIQKLENMENSENIENSQNTENVENIENLQNTKNVENIENSQNTENLENIENSQNTENVENIENSQNTENVENIENSQNTENLENIENSQNTENLENIENSQNTENLPNNRKINEDSFFHDSGETDTNVENIDADKNISNDNEEMTVYESQTNIPSVESCDYLAECMETHNGQEVVPEKLEDSSNKVDNETPEELLPELDKELPIMDDIDMPTLEPIDNSSMPQLSPVYDDISDDEDMPTLEESPVVNLSTNKPENSQNDQNIETVVKKNANSEKNEISPKSEKTSSPEKKYRDREHPFFSDPAMISLYSPDSPQTAKSQVNLIDSFMLLGQPENKAQNLKTTASSSPTSSVVPPSSVEKKSPVKEQHESSS